MAEDTPSVGSGKILGVTSLAMINVAAVLSFRNFPVMATEGWGMIFWYVLFTLAFLIPCALVAAELASTWPKAGGVYAWVKQAYPEKGGFIAIWCSWIKNIVLFPTLTSVITICLAYALLEPTLGVTNTGFMALIMLGCIWGLTYFNFHGTKMSSRLSTIGVSVGLLIPVGFLVILAILWLGGGNPNEMGALTLQSMMPGMSTDTVVFASSLVLIFAGMEMAGYHAKNTKNPKRDYPKAMMLAAAVICLVSIIGTWAVGTIVPNGQLAVNLNGGVTEAFKMSLDSLGIGWLITPIAIMLAIGTIAQMSTWMIGPSKGITPAAYDGNLPPIFWQKNKKGAPVGVLLIQAALSSVFVVIYIVMVRYDLNGYWILTAMTSLITIIMYIFMFMAFIKLRKTEPDKERPFVVPGGRAGMWLVGGAALVILIFGFTVGLFPSTEHTVTGMVTYVIIMLIGVFGIAVVPPFMISRLKKDSWMPAEEKQDR